MVKESPLTPVNIRKKGRNLLHHGVQVGLAIRKSLREKKASAGKNALGTYPAGFNMWRWEA